MKVVKIFFFFSCLTQLHVAYAPVQSLVHVDPDHHPVIKKFKYVSIAQKMHAEGGLQAQQYDAIKERFKTQPFMQAVQHFQHILEQNARAAQPVDGKDQG